MTLRVVCVSAGMLGPKKADTQLARLNQYLNYGLLGLATILSERGYQVAVFQGGFSNPSSFVDRMRAQGCFDEPVTPLLLSLPSSFAIPWAREFTAAAKVLAPQLKIVVGGRWVTEADGAWVRRQIPKVDLVVYGLAEHRIERLLDPNLWRKTSMTDAYSLGKTITENAPPQRLNFELVDQYSEYQPCVEVSRGCGMGCNFCAEALVPLGNIRSPAEVVEDLATTSKLYTGDIRPYFQASFFRPPSSWIGQLRDEFQRTGLSMSWRAESRVDGLAPEQVANLAACGLKVLDLGLESASSQQLTRMKKTPNPGAYLRRAGALLDACAENGVWAKVNVLLFPGETRETLRETAEWLDQHRSSIKGASVGPMIVFRYGKQSHDYLREVQQHGASAVREADLDELGYAHLNLSSELSHSAAVAYGLQLSREFMVANDYFDLKAFSYFPRGFTRAEFDAIVASSDSSTLPFAI